MAVTIRLQRFGAKKRPFYRVVAADRRKSRDGRFLEQLGTYDPMQQPAKVNLDYERVDYWLSVGAKPSDTVASLVRRHRGEATAEGEAPATEKPAEKAS